MLFVCNVLFVGCYLLSDVCCLLLLFVVCWYVNVCNLIIVGISVFLVCCLSFVVVCWFSHCALFVGWLVVCGLVWFVVVVCCLFVACCLVFGVRCMLFGVWCLAFGGCCFWCFVLDVCGLWFVVCGLLLVVC